MLVSIDPGKSGAYAVFSDEGELVQTWKVKVPNRQRFFSVEQLDQMDNILMSDCSGVHLTVVMEGLLDRHMPQQSAIAINTTAVNWGIQYGNWINYTDEVQIVRPVTWKTKLGLSGKDKSASVELARELVDPAFLRKARMRVDNVDIAEAILIGIYYGEKQLSWGRYPLPQK